MTAAASAIVDVQERDFETAVVERSRTVPVVVDFWAPWCGPCRALGPVLERLATEMRGAFVLAKVNVDENPELAGRFGVRGIPMVQGFRDGRVADGFTGAQPESQVRAWLKQLIPSSVDQLAEEAARLGAKDRDAAIARYRAALDADPAHQPSLLGLGRLLVLKGDPEATEVLQRVPAGTPSYTQAQALLALKDFIALAGHAPSEEGSSDGRYAAAAALARDEQWEQALQELLQIVQRGQLAGKQEPVDQARRAMLAIFGFLGEADPLVSRYRRQLANALF